MSVRPSIINMYEMLLTFCYSTKNLRNYAFVCSDIRPDIEMAGYSAGYSAQPYFEANGRKHK